MRNNKENLMEYLNDFINAPEEISRYGCEISVEEARIILDLQQRIDKAIEYINHCDEYAKTLESKYNYIIVSKLLKILRGEDNDKIE